MIRQGSTIAWKASTLSNCQINLILVGKYIVQAVIADLIKNTWITEAEQVGQIISRNVSKKKLNCMNYKFLKRGTENCCKNFNSYFFDTSCTPPVHLLYTLHHLDTLKVVLIGTSAGAAGTELNCDYLAEELQKVKSDIDVKCVSDSGTIHPPTTFAKHCRAEVLEETFYTAWSGVPDQSCLEEATDRLSCISINTAYTHLSTPIMLLTSATDSNTLDELCAQGNFVDKWAEELDTLARNMTQGGEH